MKILFAASECVPFCKTGGLADVVGALSPVLKEKGHDVRVILPLYAAIKDEFVAQMRHVLDFEVRLGWREQYCGIEELELNGVKFYFVDNKYYFGRSYIYGLGGDEFERFGFFCRAVLNALPLLPFQPDVIHAHDWLAADDSHEYNGEAGRSYTMVQAEALTQEAVIAAMDAGRFYASQGPRFEQISVEGDQVIVRCSPVQTAVFYSNEIWTAERCQTGKDMTHVVYHLAAHHTESFVRVQIIDLEGNNAWSSPIRL